MTETDNILWQTINRFQLDEPGVDLSFSDRLARENGQPVFNAVVV
jgi:hypothetical protein